MTEPFTLDEAAAWTGGRLSSAEAGTESLSAVSTDTRTLAPGSLFVAIRGPRHDAHDHLADAVANGAAALLVERMPTDAVKVPTLLVDDTTRALGALAAGHRRRFAGPVIAITGSNGKTTTKEMCASILYVAGPCLKNRGNLNNEYGLPLTLLSREAEHRALVVEIGMNHRGEIAPLAAIAAPTVGVITNVGTAHIEHLGSQEEIALEKGDLVAGLPASACAVLNADDPRVLAQAERTKARVIRFGCGPDADLRAEGIVAEPTGHYRFDLAWGKERHEVSVAGLGEPTVINALAAAAGALAAGFGLPDVVRGLASYAGIEGRMARIGLDDGSVVIDDTYNANPQSMEAALRSLGRFREGRRAFAALGSMGELGDTAPDAHRAMGRVAAELDLTGLLALGEHAERLAEGAREAGLPADRVVVAADHDDLLAQLDARRRPGDWILVKGSRSMQMERIVRGLAEGKES